MVWTVGKDWKAEAEAKIAVENKPDVLRLLSSSLEAQELREQYSSHVTASLSHVEGSILNWDSLVDIMLDSALKILGPTPKRSLRPWFKGKESELATLESLARNTELDLREARRTQSPNVATLLDKRRQISKNLQSKKKQWEAQWWEDLAVKAEKAGQRGNEFEFWQVCRLLGLRDSGQHRSLSKRTVADPVVDREAWKTFLREIQADKGQVNPDVWQHVSPVPTDVALFNSPPSWKEFSTALSAMHNGKRGGIDLVSVEMIKYGGSPLQAEVFRIIGDMWEEAASAHPGHETKTWCASTTTGVCIPVFKNKGDRTDRNNYRNLVMLSVAAKIIAKVIAMRLSCWAEGFLDEEQNGFRKNRGIDDAHQVARRIIEEVVVAQHDKVVAITSFDIIRAYTRVCRHALWELLTRLGLPTSFLQVVKALHEHTTFTVFIHNGYSSALLTERGLREGCPSPPVLFNIFHSYILKTFRHRRALQAHNLNLTPGLPWCFKVDGHLTRTVAGKHSSRGVLKVCLGDVEYADDTQIVGYEEEVDLAETLFQNTPLDWAQQEHTQKREKLILSSGGRCRMDVTREFEQKTMKHLGAFLNDTADYWPDTKKRVQAGFLAVKRRPLKHDANHDFFKGNGF